MTSSNASWPWQNRQTWRRSLQRRDASSSFIVAPTIRTAITSKTPATREIRVWNWATPKIGLNSLLALICLNTVAKVASHSARVSPPRKRTKSRRKKRRSSKSSRKRSSGGTRTIVRWTGRNSPKQFVGVILNKEDG